MKVLPVVVVLLSLLTPALSLDFYDSCENVSRTIYSIAEIDIPEFWYVVDVENTAADRYFWTGTYFCWLPTDFNSEFCPQDAWESGQIEEYKNAIKFDEYDSLDGTLPIPFYPYIYENNTENGTVLISIKTPYVSYYNFRTGIWFEPYEKKQFSYFGKTKCACSDNKCSWFLSALGGEFSEGTATSEPTVIYKDNSNFVDYVIFGKYRIFTPELFFSSPLEVTKAIMVYTFEVKNYGFNRYCNSSECTVLHDLSEATYIVPAPFVLKGGSLVYAEPKPFTSIDRIGEENEVSIPDWKSWTDVKNSFKLKWNIGISTPFFVDTDDAEKVEIPVWRLHLEEGEGVNVTVIYVYSKSRVIRSILKSPEVPEWDEWGS